MNPNPSQAQAFVGPETPGANPNPRDFERERTLRDEAVYAAIHCVATTPGHEPSPDQIIEAMGGVERADDVFRRWKAQHIYDIGAYLLSVKDKALAERFTAWLLRSNYKAQLIERISGVRLAVLARIAEARGQALSSSPAPRATPTALLGGRKNA